MKQERPVASQGIPTLQGREEVNTALTGVTGPEAFTLAEAAARLGAVVGREIRFENETRAAAYASRAHYGAPEFEVTGWVTSYAAIAAGELSAVSGDVAALTGHPPQRFAEYLAAHPGSWEHLQVG